MNDTRVAITISTMNRPDFIIRTMNYYAKMQSPHPLYLADSSNPENARIIKTHIKNLQGKLEVKYFWCPPKLDNTEMLLSHVKEDYAVINGDDDYEIPSSLTKCAEFLENNPDYASAGGYSVTFRLKSSGPYGEISRLADYRWYPLEAGVASQRLTDFVKNSFVITFGVNRVEHLKKMWVGGPISMITNWNELIQNCYCAVSGKSKLIDCLSCVRHIHDRQHHDDNLIDWITSKDFYNSYASFRGHVANKIMEMDNIPLDRAERAVKYSFLECLRGYMALDWQGQENKPRSPKSWSVFKKLRSDAGATFPILKTIYRSLIRPLITNKKQLHYEVLQQNSKYYKDFKPVMDSFTGKLDL